MVVESLIYLVWFKNFENRHVCLVPPYPCLAQSGGCRYAIRVLDLLHALFVA